MPPPSSPQQPALRRRHTRTTALSAARRPRAPAIEHVRRRAGIQPSHPLALRRAMMSSVQQHIAKGVLHFTRRRQRPRMILIRQHPPPPPKLSVQSTRNSYAQPLHASRKSALTLRFDDHMHVIALHGEVHQPKPCPVSPLAKGGPQRPHAPLPSQIRHVPSHLQGDMHRVRARQPQPLLMRDTRPLSHRLSAGARPLTTPRPVRERQLLGARHLD